jgi:cyclohexyl-isocyanide hydratase
VKTAFILFNHLTALDFVGIYDPLTRLKSMNVLPDFEWRICARTKEVSDDRGLRFIADSVNEPLDRYDMIVVPGGFGTRELVADPDFIQWLKTSAPARLKVSVCTGALLLGAAGFLKGKRATTHPNNFSDLQPFCACVVDARIVDEGDVITARGVTSAIDLGLYLIEKLAGPDARARIAKQMDYPYVCSSVQTNNQSKA